MESGSLCSRMLSLYLLTFSTPSMLTRICAHELTADAAGRWFIVRGILYKGTLARNPRCSRHRRIDEADISTPVAVDQRAANYLEKAAKSFNAMRSRCRLSHADVTFRRPLPVFRVVRCSSVYCFQTRINVKLFHCTRAPMAQ
ncbi:uncharacterized protein TNCV_807231 [Trichonephila clavipes]|nr:uncharacterized protein TNCV_807231 [Trichonephila clavipes]